MSKLAILLLGATGFLGAGCGDAGGDSPDGSGGAGSTGSLTTDSTSTDSTSTDSTSTGSGNPSIDNCTVFPQDNPWNADVSGLQVHPNSDGFVDWIGRDTHLHPDFGSDFGIPYAVVPGTQPKVPCSFDYADESDPGPYPIPPDVPVEDGGDSHVLVIDGDNCVLYEMFAANTSDGGASWDAGSGAIWDLKTNSTRPAGWTSADAAGLPIFPGLARYDQAVTKGVIDHALRFTVSDSQAAYIAPASHYASDTTNTDAPPMGLRFRMKAGYDCSGYSQEAQVFCTAFKKYGLIVADNGSDWFISGAPDSQWNDDALNDLKQITGDAFEAVYTGDPVTN